MTQHDRLQELCVEKKFVAVFNEGRIHLVPCDNVESYDTVEEVIEALEKK